MVGFIYGIRIHRTKLTYILSKWKLKICDEKDCITY